MKRIYCMDVIEKALSEKAFPSAAVAVGRGRELYLSAVLGNRTEHPTPIPADEHTRFDLASLTKVVSTTMVALRMLEEGKLLLTHPLSRYFTEDELKDAPAGRRDVSIFQLMTHTSGITPHMPLWNMTDDPKAVPALILSSPPFCDVGANVHYSCMGYILLANILERISDEPLNVLAKRYVFDPLDMPQTTYCPTDKNVAATEYSPLRGTYISGEVHDENAHFLGGVSGNAGVFSPLTDMTRFAMMLSERGKIPDGRFLSATTFDLMTQNFTPGMNECRGLGLQLKPPMPALSAMGDLMHEGSYGHTGFTGTSLYVDVKTGLWGVLLTNAVHYGRDKTGLFDARRRFYNAMVADFD